MLLMMMVSVLDFIARPPAATNDIVTTGSAAQNTRINAGWTKTKSWIWFYRVQACPVMILYGEVACG
jgi:hypothetical protein